MKIGNPKIKDVVRIVVLVVCAAVLGVNFYQANASRLAGNQMPMPFGIGTAIVLSGSMEPEISVGDFIVVSEKKAYGEDSIVVFQDGRSLVVHRVVEINDNTIVTKGDANNTVDNPVEKTMVKGTVIAVIPQIGSVVSFIQTPIGTMLFAIMAVVLIELPYRREKQMDEKKRQEIIEEINCLKDELSKERNGYECRTEQKKIE